MILNIVSGTSTLTGSEGVVLTLTCSSKRGYPQQTVEWFKRNTNLSLSNCSVSYEMEDGLYNVNKSCSFMPTLEDDGTTFTCQSSYSGVPSLVDSSTAVLRIDRKTMIARILY